MVIFKWILPVLGRGQSSHLLVSFLVSFFEDWDFHCGGISHPWLVLFLDSFLSTTVKSSVSLNFLIMLLGVCRLAIEFPQSFITLNLVTVLIIFQCFLEEFFLMYVILEPREIKPNEYPVLSKFKKYLWFS